MRIESALAELERCLRQQCDEADEPLRAVCVYAVEGGSRTRAALLLHAVGELTSEALAAAAAIEMLHAATLLQDDIIDGSGRRRQRAAAHVRFGQAQAILASDWLLVRALESAASVHFEFFVHLARTGRAMAQAVATELSPEGCEDLLAAQLHSERVSLGKTATLFACTLRCAALLRGCSAFERQSWDSIGCQIGMIHQLLDDCMDVYLDADTLGKDVGCDLAGGRITLPWGTAREFERLAECAVADESKIPSAPDRVLRTSASSEVRESLEALLVRRIDAVKASAEKTGLPHDAINVWRRSAEHKLELCFRQTRPCSVVSTHRFRSSRLSQQQLA